MNLARFIRDAHEVTDKKIVPRTIVPRTSRKLLVISSRDQSRASVKRICDTNVCYGIMSLWVNFSQLPQIRLWIIKRFTGRSRSCS